MHMTHFLLGDRCTEADPEYVKEFYDGIAESFEKKLVLHLGYRGPWILRDMISRAAARHPSSWTTRAARGLRLFDLGCGSGLCGRVFSPLVRSGVLSAPEDALSTVEKTLERLGGSASPGHGPAPETAPTAIVSISEFADAIPAEGSVLTGIDISSKMVDLAAAPANGYSILTCGHLEDGLRAFALPAFDRAKLDIVTSADTFIYVGALDKVFELLSHCVSSGGLVAFSTEHLSGAAESTAQDGFKLLGSGRFGHSTGYIERLCASNGFSIVISESHVLRTESAEPIPGMFYVVERNSFAASVSSNITTGGV
jgi:predicted TPR repeat methyltransferase